MKTYNSLFRKIMEIFHRGVSIVLMILLVVILCDCSSDDEDTWQIIDDGIVSSWILKSAVFRSPVDLDGPGNILPTTDAKEVIYGIFDVYVNCGSIDDIPFQFTTEPPLNIGLSVYYEGTAFSANAVCPEGQGVTSWVCDYAFADNSGTEYKPLIYLLKQNPVDPALLFDWQGGMILRVLSSDVIDGRYTISGELREGSLISSLPEPKPDLTFDFVMERIDPHQETE